MEFSAEPGPDEVHLWVACPRSPDLPLGNYETWLSPDERTRWGRFRFEAHRREYLVTRALVRSVLSEYRPGPPDRWRFTANSYGKPETDPPAGLQFNLSNSPDLVACLVGTRGPVGIDIEPETRAAAIDEVAAEVFSPQELEDYRSLPPGRDRERRALHLWTLKETYIKVRGMGLSLPLKQFTWVFGTEGSLDLAIDPALGDTPDHWWFGRICLGDHQGAVMAEGPGPIRLKVFAASPLVAPPRLVADQVLDRGEDLRLPLL